MASDDLRVEENAVRFTETGPEALQLRAAAGRHCNLPRRRNSTRW